MAVYSICYVSTADRSLSKDDIHTILEESTASNMQNNVTGVLLHKDGNFLQLIEGDKETIIALYYGKIIHDKRHPKCTKIFEKEFQYRFFAGYGNGFMGAESSIQYSQLKRYLQLLQELNHQESNLMTKTIIAFLS